MGQNGLQRGPRGSKCVHKKGSTCIKARPIGFKWLKMASTRVKMGQNGSKCGPEGPPRPKGVKMASKWPQIPQNGLFQAKFVLTGEGPPSNQTKKKTVECIWNKKSMPRRAEICKYWALTEELPLRRNLGLALTYVACPNDLYPMPRKPPIGKGTVIETPRNKM